MQQPENISCIVGEHSVVCNGIHYFLPEEPLTAKDQLFWLYLVAYISVVLFAGMMSGLTLAIFSLDLTSLKVLESAGSAKDKKCAKRIMPLARRQYLVLVSLVLANSSAVEAMPLLLDRISTPIIAIAVSVSAVLIFGEVLPQAVCGRFGLVIGYYFAWLVWGLIGILFVIAWPLSKLLEWLLGKNRGTFYRRAELKALVDIHGPEKLPLKKSRKPKKRADSLLNKDLPLAAAAVEEAQRIAAERLTIDEVLIIRGALEMATKHAEDAMIKLDDVFMLSINDPIDETRLQLILEEGHSRIPIYTDDNREHVHGVLLTKRLVTVNPKISCCVKDFVEDPRYYYPPYYIDAKMPLYKLLNIFQEGKSTHIGFVTQQNDDNSLRVVGIVTLEDIIEELLLEEIYDETDLIRDVSRRIQLARAYALRSMSVVENKKCFIKQKPTYPNLQETMSKKQDRTRSVPLVVKFSQLENAKEAAMD